MAAPPVDVGGVKAILALVLPGVAAPMVGAPATVIVTTGVVVVVSLELLPLLHAVSTSAAISVMQKIVGRTERSRELLILAHPF